MCKLGKMGPLEQIQGHLESGYQIGWFILKPGTRPPGNFIFLKRILRSMASLEDVLGVPVLPGV